MLESGICQDRLSGGLHAGKRGESSQKNTGWEILGYTPSGFGNSNCNTVCSVQAMSSPVRVDEGDGDVLEEGLGHCAERYSGLIETNTPRKLSAKGQWVT